MAGNRRIVGLAVLALVLESRLPGRRDRRRRRGRRCQDRHRCDHRALPGGNAEQDCIYLGVLSDLTEGPFRALAVPITEGQKAFWKRVNDQGGIGGRYEVNIETYTRDNKYNQEHVAKYREIEPRSSPSARPSGPRRPWPASPSTRRPTSSPPPPPGGRAGSSRTSSWRAATATAPRP